MFSIVKHVVSISHEKYNHQIIRFQKQQLAVEIPVMAVEQLCWLQAPVKISRESQTLRRDANRLPKWHHIVLKILTISFTVF